MNQSSISIKETFQDQIKDLQSLANQLRSTLNRFAALRFIYFLLTLVLAVYFINVREGVYAGITILPFPLLFGLLVKRYNKIQRSYSLNFAKIQYLKDEIDRYDLKLEKLDGGEEFVDHDHPYASDLDLFGRYSVFSILNRSKLKFGRRKLADWLRNAASIIEIQERQQAIKELNTQQAFRLEWFAESYINQKKKAPKNEFKGFTETYLKTKSSARIIATLGILQIFGTTVIAISGILPWSVVGLSVLINIALMALFLRSATGLFNEMGDLGYLLQSYKNIFQLAEGKDYHSPLLNRLSEDLKQPSAYKAVQEIDKHLYWINSRQGMFYWVVNSFFLIDIWLLSGITSWAKKYDSKIPVWFTAIGELESLLSLSAFHYLNSNFSFPKFNAEGVSYRAKELGHPLIPLHERVTNDFHLEDSGSIILLTGANMSGKTTFERTLGVNLVLAQAGAPACCSELTCSLLQPFTSMRTQDKLEESTSSFYAELKRIKKLLDLLDDEANKLPVFYLLDEILKGTNSEDRNIGAESLIRQLVKTNSMGLISTHDLSLSGLEKQIARFANYSFNSQILQGEVSFDYKLNEGPCHTFNAVPLMKKMGIEIVDKKHND